MEMFLSDGFSEITMKESLLVDGGVNPWAVGSAVWGIACGGFAIAASVADPEPVSKTYAFYSGCCGVVSGVEGIIAACQ